MKTLLSILLACLAALAGTAGQPENIMVKNIFCHEVMDGTRTGKSYIRIQQTYDSSNHLVLERFYSDSVKGQVGYRWYFYNEGGRLKSIESYGMDRKPLTLIQVTYNAGGDTARIIRHKGTGNGIIKASEKKFIYGSDGLLRQTRTVSPEGRVLETVKYTYKKGTKVPARVTVTNRSDSPFREKIANTLNDSTGMPASALRQFRSQAGGSGYSVRVTYNSRGNPAEELYLEADRPFRKKCYEYAAGVELEKSYEEDGNGKLVAYTTIETYWHKANLNRKSYFE